MAAVKPIAQIASLIIFPLFSGSLLAPFNLNIKYISSTANKAQQMYETKEKIIVRVLVNFSLIGFVGSSSKINWSEKEEVVSLT
jgi:hypothetical protein